MTVSLAALRSQWAAKWYGGASVRIPGGSKMAPGRVRRRDSIRISRLRKTSMSMSILRDNQYQAIDEKYVTLLNLSKFDLIWTINFELTAHH
ncbi:unnamed protein product [Darwinula stevensoni]|uniref:Uncharacterized protein n=1 Tax=Darwinula stevensoni TaxID=69355 RepID=A0A7R8X609_9CRUS|nr:unnamed protein product [Darwinula stevensoni]CAG0887170.1 unnamed protein product [Darwinula stevensoni]